MDTYLHAHPAPSPQRSPRSYLRSLDERPPWPQPQERNLRPSSQLASSGAEGPRRAVRTQQALVVGIGAYSAALNSLDNAPRDARTVAEILASEYGFTLLPGGDPLLDDRAGLDAIRQAVLDSLRKAARDTRWLFYFAGHGWVAAEQGYLLPADAAGDDPGTWLPLQWLLDACLDSACGEVLIVLDACYSGRALVRGETLDDSLPSPDERRVRQIVTSGNPRQPVLDGGGSGHSIFTQSLLDVLRGWAGIHEPETGYVRFASLLDHLKHEVPRRLDELQQRSGSQQPIGGYLVGNRDGRDFVLEPTVRRLPPEVVRDLRSPDVARRTSGLQALVRAADASPEIRAQAVRAAVRCLQSERYALAFWAQQGEPPPLLGQPQRYELAAEVRVQAAAALGALADPTTVAPLVAALQDVPEVCREAARALARLGDPGAAPPLLERCRTADDATFLDLIDALGAIGDTRAILDALRQSVSRELLVPFVGPDFSRDLTGLPDRVAITRALSRYAESPPGGSLAAVAEATMGPGQSRYTFTRAMRDVLYNRRAPSHDIYRTLARLQVPFWVSGAYDGGLTGALNADQVLAGGEVPYAGASGRRVVVRLLGDPLRPESLVVLEKDYQHLRADDQDRRMLVDYLARQLQHKIALFLGYDPGSPDYALLVRHVLNGHLAAADMRAFLVWPESGPEHAWSGRPIRAICAEPLAFVASLAASADRPKIDGG